MPTLGQKVDLLFKKFIAQKSTVNAAGSSAASFAPQSTAYNQEFFGSKQSITAEQIWTQTKYMPITNNPLNKLSAPVLRVSGSNGELYTDGIDLTNPNAPILMVDGQSIVQRLDLQLNNVAGSPYTWAFAKDATSFAIGQADWVSVWGSLNTFTGYNVIPFSFDPTGTIFRYQLYSAKSAGADATWGTSYTLTGEVPFLHPSDWFFDQDALVLNFMNGEPGSSANAGLPAGISSNAPLYIRVYRYIGKVGDFSGSGGPNSFSSSTAYLENATGAVDLDLLVPGTTPGTRGIWSATKEGTYVYVAAAFPHPDALGGTFAKGTLLHFSTTEGRWEPILPVDGLRLLARIENIDQINTYKFIAPAGPTANDTILANSIVEYWKASVRGTGTDGFVKIMPIDGQRIAIESDANKIWVYATNTWIEEVISSAMGSLDNKDMVANITGRKVVGGVTSYSIKAVDNPLIKLPSGSGYVEVQVNGVAVKIGDGYDDVKLPSACFALQLPSYTSVLNGGSYNLTFSSSTTLLSNDRIAFVTNDGVVHVPIVSMSGAVASIPAIDFPSGNPQAFMLRKYSKISTGDILVWFGANAKFELDANDRVSYIYVSAI